MIGIGEVLVAALAINKSGINEGQPKLNRDKYPAFNTDETDPEKFWNSLNRGKYFTVCGKRCYHLKHDIGSLASAQGYMTPNTRWDGSSTKYKDLNRKQQRIIAATLKCKDEPYSMFAIRGLCGDLFRIK